jgi:hypothetical protein
MLEGIEALAALEQLGKESCAAYAPEVVRRDSRRWAM